VFETTRKRALSKLTPGEIQALGLEGEGSIDLTSDKMQRVFAKWVDVMRQVASSTLPDGPCDLFFNKFATEMQDWEEKAKDL
jgi:hypothetical protein